MKKQLILLVFLMMMAALTTVFVGCTHTHTFGEWVEETPATCTANGSRSRTCECGYKEYETIDVLKEEFTKKHDNNYCWDECIYCKREANKQNHKYSKNTCVDCKFVWQATQGLELTLLSDGSGYSVTGIGTATETDITIPLTGYNDNLPVVAIGDYAFFYCNNLTNIIIPDSVTSIGDYAFYFCDNLTTVTIGNGVTSIGDYAFASCDSLTSITVDANNPNYKSIDGNLYTKDGKTLVQYAIGKTATTFTVPDSVTSIGIYAFSKCYKLTSIVIPDSVTSIGGYAFSECYKLTSITIGNGVTSIGGSAFSNTGYYNNQDNWIDGVLYIGRYLIVANTLLSGSYTVKDTTLVIADDAFRGCSGLTSVTIGNGVTSIGDHAFENCRSLTSIVIPDSVTTIGAYTFSDCDNLTSITVDTNNPNYKSIDGNLYTKDGKTLVQYAIGKTATAFTLPDSVTSIGDYAFENCRNLISIVIPDSVTTIGDYAFFSCDNLTSVTIGNGVTSIGDCAFSVCDNLTSITVDTNNPNYKSIDGNLYTKDGKTLVQYAIGKTATTFTVPDSVTSIGNYAFSGCYSLTSVTIGSGVTTIGAFAFSRCDNLRSVVIPDSVTSIGDYAFASCDNLTSVTIGNGVTTIGDSAFSGCNNLTSIVIPDSVTTIGAYTFSDCDNLTSITVDTNNSNYKSIDGNLYTKDGKMLVQYAIGKTATTFTVPDSVTSIGDYAFYQCYNLTSVTIGNGVTTIGDSAFSRCENLTSVTIGNGVTSIGDWAFCNCDNLTSIVIPDSVTSIGDYAFYSCDKLTSVTIGNGVTSIGDYAFAWCYKLTSIVIPDGVTSIGANAFAYCDNLTSVTIGNGVTSIGYYAFAYCRSLTKVYYKGNASDWSKIAIGDGIFYRLGSAATVYYYSETEPQLNAEGTAYDGNYWHYDADGKTPVIWTKQD